MSRLSTLNNRLRGLLHELAKFGVVGAVAFVIDVSIFTLLRDLDVGPLSAKTLATAVAATFAYFGNRHWSFRHRAYSGLRREYLVFIVITVIGLAIQLSVLGISHYVLGFTSILADNIAANGVGMIFGTTFRFFAYKRWVFLSPERAAARAVVADSLGPAPAGQAPFDEGPVEQAVPPGEASSRGGLAAR